MSNKKLSFKKYSKSDSILVFQYNDNYQDEVQEAINLRFAELVNCKIGKEDEQEVLFVKVKEATKNRKSRWQNVSVNEAVAIEYIDINGEVFVKKCKITTIKSIEQKYLEDEDYELLDAMNKSEAVVNFNPNSKGCDEIIKIDLRNGIENIKVKRKQY